MVDLTDAGSPFQQSIPDFAFYVPAIVVFTLADANR
ncbi:GM20449 [Drosophila sechellia]|uniref:GM20449 n=1 Tax=Drosophila sechellia TaxID=7238 RepID=B4HNE8_DROSE|nr:GM20449 [Drosophila sechellia]